MFCTSCGTKNAADSNFCKQCGGKLDRATAAKISQDEFERALPEDEQVSALLERAYLLRKEDNLEGAIALCEEILRLRDDSTSAHSLLGQVYEQKGDREAALREYERVLQLNPGSIADRVKLDELRGHTGAGTERKSLPRVVMADPQATPGLGYARFTSAGLAIALLALGGLVALQFRPHSAPVADNSAATANSGVKTSTGAAVNTNNPTVPNTSAAGSSTPGLPTPANGNGNPVASASALPNTAINSPAIGNVAANTTAPNAVAPNSATPTPPPRVIYQQGPVRYVTVPPPSTSGLASPRLPGIKPPRNGNSNGGARITSNNGNNENGSGRVVLNGDPDVTESNGKITLAVNPADMSGKNNGKNGKGEGNGETGGYGKVEVEKTPSGGVRHAPPPGPASTTESRSFLALGDEKKRQRDYRGAIDAFTKALGSAGDQAGYVLQQRALCFQQLNNLASAKADYESAINEYRKLEARDPETARNGVRACEKGIKTCGN